MAVLGIKFIRITDDLLFKGLRGHVAKGDGQFPGSNVFYRDSHADMAFTDQSVPG